MREETPYDLLIEVGKLFEKYGISFWLDSGTLLGLVRDGKLIEKDNDMDLRVWKSDILQMC